MFLLLAWARRDTASIFSFKYLRLEVGAFARTNKRTRSLTRAPSPADLEVTWPHIPRGGVEGEIILHS